MARPSFQLPKDGTIYAETIFSRCRDLVGYDVWGGLQRHRLDAWINNFHTGEELYFAARVLDALIYRPDRQTVSLMKQLFQRALPDWSRRAGLPSTLRTLYQSLRDRTVDPNVRVVPVLAPGDPPTKSGHTIARMLRRQLGFAERWIVNPGDVLAMAGHLTSIVLVDDFLGTGTQFSTFLTTSGLDAFLSSGCIVYAPLVAHEQGVQDVCAAFPGLHVTTVESLGDNHALFHPDAGHFPDDVNTAESARDFYYALLRDRQIDITGPDRRGFGHFELVYSFEHAVPDNSLPILWWRQSDDWRPLFDR